MSRNVVNDISLSINSSHKAIFVKHHGLDYKKIRRPKNGSDGRPQCSAACASRSSLMCLSCWSSVSVEDVCATGANVWFDVNLFSDSSKTLSLVRRAERAGCRAVVVTLDAVCYTGDNNSFIGDFSKLAIAKKQQHMSTEERQINKGCKLKLFTNDVFHTNSNIHIISAIYPM